MLVVPSLLAVLAAALVHVFLGRLPFGRSGASARWTSAAGGVAVGYLFLILLPKLGGALPLFEAIGSEGIYRYLGYHSYLVALIGMLTFWGVERSVVLVVNRVVESARDGTGPRRGAGSALRRAFVTPLLYLQTAGYAVHSMLIGYLVASSSNLTTLILFALAMCLHLAVLDSGLRHKLGEAYDDFERWVFAAAALAGWVIAMTVDVSRTTVALFNSFFAGMLLFVVIRNEIPSPERGRFLPFFGGAAAYAVLVLAIEAL